MIRMWQWGAKIKKTGEGRKKRTKEKANLMQTKNRMKAVGGGKMVPAKTYKL